MIGRASIDEIEFQFRAAKAKTDKARSAYVAAQAELLQAQNEEREARRLCYFRRNARRDEA